MLTHAFLKCEMETFKYAAWEWEIECLNKWGRHEQFQKYTRASTQWPHWEENTFARGRYGNY
jgi:hypothetical protein